MTNLIHLTFLGSGSSAGAGLHLEFRQRARAVNRSARPTQRQVRIVEQLQAESRDVLHIRFYLHAYRVLGRRVALGEKRAVRQRQILLPAVRFLIDLRPHDNPIRLIVLDGFLPAVHARAPVGMLVSQLVLDAVDVAENLGAAHLFVRRVGGDVRFVCVVEEREHPIILGLGQRIELVIVALGALNGQTEDALADGVHAVEHRFHAELLRIDAALFVNHGVAQEARRYSLILSWRSGKQIAGQLFDDELIVGQIAVEGVDDPIAIEPHLPRFVFLEAVAIGVASGVEPVPAPAFAVVRAGQQALDDLSRKPARSYRRGTHRPLRPWAASQSSRD